MGWTNWVDWARRLAGVAAVFGLAACSSGSPASPPALPTILPLMISPVLSELHLCTAVPPAVVEAVLGRKLVSPPDWFQYPDAPGSAGCQYNAGQDSAGNALFAYIALMPPHIFDQQPRYQDEPVSGIGNAAYFNNGPDARQLWVKLDKVSLVVAIGDVPNEAGLKQLATLLVDAIRAGEK